MPEIDPTNLPTVSPEDRRTCAAQFERANQVIASSNHDYGIQLLLSCCKLDPGNLIYRQTLRRTERTKFKNNLRGSRFAWLTASRARARLKAAKRKRAYVKVLEHGEEVLVRNPWDISAQMDMAEAADALGQPDLAIWLLDQARHKDPNLPAINRSLARLFEKQGNFAQAIGLWELVRKADPSDIEAVHKAKDLAASEPSSRGQYEKVPTNPKGEPATPAAPAPSLLPAMERLAQEVATLQVRIDADPTRPSGYLDLAALYRRFNQPDQARTVLQRGLGPTGNHFQITLELMELELESFRQNLAVAEDKLQADPANEALRNIRQGFRKEINTREIELYRAKADRFPMELTHRLELGARLLRAGQIEEAIKELQIARTDARLGWRALMYLGYCFKNRNNWKQARRNFEESLQAAPPQEAASRKELLFMLATGFAEAGEFTEALEQAHELAHIDLAYRDIGRLIDEWQSRLQQA